MNWLSPLGFEPQPRRVTIRARDGAVMPDTSKPVEINGVRYYSMAQASRMLGWSYSKIYKAIGEAWRYAKRHTPGDTVK